MHQDFKKTVTYSIIDHQDHLQSAKPSSSTEIESIIVTEDNPHSRLCSCVLLTADSGGCQLLGNKGVAIASPRMRAQEGLKIGLVYADKYAHAVAVKNFLEDLLYRFS
eukprot:1126806-Ditylum_brightwellii.AAC.1